MRAERHLAGQRAWSIMLADVVALLLTFFVLGLSMRELDGGPATGLMPIDPDRPVIALVMQGNVAERAAPEISAEADRSFAYLAALLREQGDLATSANISYTEFQLNIDMADPASSASSAERSALTELMATYAYLARRFALQASFRLPTRVDETLPARLDRVLAFQHRLTQELGLVDAEVVVAAAGEPDGDRLRLALRTQPPPGDTLTNPP
jgi:hypothetical protein